MTKGCRSRNTERENIEQLRSPKSEAGLERAWPKRGPKRITRAAKLMGARPGRGRKPGLRASEGGRTVSAGERKKNSAEGTPAEVPHYQERGLKATGSPQQIEGGRGGLQESGNKKTPGVQWREREERINAGPARGWRRIRLG